MDAIQKIVDWMKDVNWVISLLAAIPLSIAANLLTPKVANWWSQRSDSKKAKRREKLKAELERIRNIASNKETLHFENTLTLFKTLALIAMGGAAEMLDPISALFYLLAIIVIDRHITLIKQCKDFVEYEKQAQLQIDSL